MNKKKIKKSYQELIIKLNTKKKYFLTPQDQGRFSKLNLGLTMFNLGLYF